MCCPNLATWQPRACIVTQVGAATDWADMDQPRRLSCLKTFPLQSGKSSTVAAARISCHRVDGKSDGAISGCGRTLIEQVIDACGGRSGVIQLVR